VEIQQNSYIFFKYSIVFNNPFSKSIFIYKPLPLDDPTNRNPDIKLAKKILNWQPKINLETGLLKTIKYLKTNN